MEPPGAFFAFPDGFRPGNTTGLRPLCTFQRSIPDFCSWAGRLVLVGQDASRIGVPRAAPGHPHSKLQFVFPGRAGKLGTQSRVRLPVAGGRGGGGRGK